MIPAGTATGTGLASAVDMAFGWLLDLPRDVTLLVFAIITAGLMVLVRRGVTNQDLLRRCSADLRQLKRLWKQARSVGDETSQNRIRTTIGQIKGKQLAADLRVLAIVLIPIGMLAIWASERLEYLPPKIGDDLIVRAYFPLSSIDRLTHVVPEPSLEIKTAPILVVRSSEGLPRRGVAEWSIRPLDAGLQQITIRHQGETLRHPVLINQRIYSAPHLDHAGRQPVSTEVRLQQYRPLGMSLGSEWIGLPSWMIGYLILTLALTPVLRRLCKVA